LNGWIFAKSLLHFFQQGHECRTVIPGSWTKNEKIKVYELDKGLIVVDLRKEILD